MLELVERVVVMEAGRVVLDGPRDKVLAAVAGRTPARAAPTANAEVAPNAGPAEASPVAAPAPAPAGESVAASAA